VTEKKAQEILFSVDIFKKVLILDLDFIRLAILNE